MLSILSSLKFPCEVRNLPFPKLALVFRCMQYKYKENAAGKGENYSYQAISAFPTVFSIIGRTFCHSF